METSSALNAKGGDGFYPQVEGFCLARGKNLKRIKCFKTGDMLPYCWRGGKCSVGTCDTCLLCPSCQCECNNIPRDLKHQKWDDQGGKVLKRGRATKGDSRHEAGAALITDAAKKLAEQRRSPEKKQKRAAAHNAEAHIRLDLKAEDRALELGAEGRLVDPDKEGFSGRSFDSDYVHSAQKKSPVLEGEFAPAKLRNTFGGDIESSTSSGSSWRFTAGLDAGVVHSARRVQQVDSPFPSLLCLDPPPLPLVRQEMYILKLVSFLFLPS